MGMEFLFEGEKKVLKLDYGESCTILYEHRIVGKVIALYTLNKWSLRYVSGNSIEMLVYF